MQVRRAGVGGENDRERARGSSEHRPSKLSHAEAAQYLRQWPGHRALCPPQASAELGVSISIEIAAAKPPVMTREQRLELAARKKAEFEARRREREQGAQLASAGVGAAPAGGMFQTASQLHKMR